MGIKQLSKVVADIAPGAIKQQEMKNYFGRTIAVDASMCLYQFLIAVRSEGSYQLTDEKGETTSHIIGMFYRTIRMLDNGLKPVYVFDGKPPTMKGGELAKRAEKREAAAQELKEAEEKGDQENIEKFTKRLVKVEKQHTEDVKRLLTLMGVPYLTAPCEAEAQCAELVKKGKCYGVGTEDMDALTFGTHKLVRHLTFSESRKIPIQEFDLDKILKESGLSMNEFIDLCILLGCDYCDTIKGIGPKKALSLIQDYKNIETILTKIDQEKYPPPPEWPYKEARRLFQEPEIDDGAKVDIKFQDPDEEGLIQFLCTEKNFAEERVRNGVKKILAAKGKSKQGRLDSFFKVLPSTTPAASTKRKPDPKGKSKGNASKRGRR
ncbi:hypothetical protein ACHWQZ_G011781 [Mnemiopsis leidyi]